MQAVATHLRIDAVIGGAVVGEGRARTLLIAVRYGSTGHVIARGQYDLSGRTLPMVRERVIGDLVRALEHVNEVPRSGPGRTPEAGRTPSDVEPSDVEPTDAVGRAGAEPQNDPTLCRSRGARRCARSRCRSRAFAPASASRCSRARCRSTSPRRRPTPAARVGGVRADGAVFPLALSAELAQAHPVLASFGFVGSLRARLRLHVVDGGRQSPRPRVALDGAVRRAHPARPRGVRRHAARRDRVPAAHRGATSRSSTSACPTSIRSVDGGLQWERASSAAGPMLALRFAYLGPVSAGDIESDAQYGRSTGWGIEADGGLTACPTRWLWLRLDGRYSRVGLSFARRGHAVRALVAGSVGVGIARGRLCAVAFCGLWLY